jgi:hypothetical protein
LQKLDSRRHLQPTLTLGPKSLDIGLLGVVVEGGLVNKLFVKHKYLGAANWLVQQVLDTTRLLARRLDQRLEGCSYLVDVLGQGYGGGYQANHRRNIGCKTQKIV